MIGEIDCLRICWWLRGKLSKDETDKYASIKVECLLKRRQSLYFKTIDSWFGYLWSELHGFVAL